MTSESIRGTGHQMIRSINLHNFRCFEKLRIDNVQRLNVITGDNGSGKTALLEAIFLALATGSGVAMRFRQQRGLDGMFAGTARRIEESMWGGIFFDYDMQRRVTIQLDGDGDESRSVEIARGRSTITLPLNQPELNHGVLAAPVSFTWRNAAGEESIVTPSFKDGNISLPDTGEDMPNFFFIPALVVIGSAENAGRFSELSQINAQDRLVKIITNEFKWIDDLSIEISAGAPAIFASIKGTKKKIPLPEISTGINRMVAIFLAIASRPGSIVLIDEIENGIYHRHYRAMWSAIIALLRENSSQLFVSCHSAECLSALGVSMGRKSEDISLWQFERNANGPSINQIPGKKMKASLDYNEDIR